MKLGHTNANMFFRVYSKWIDGADRSRERDKLNVGSEEVSAIRSVKSQDKVDILAPFSTQE